MTYVDLNLIPPMSVYGHAIAMLPDYLTIQFPCQMQCKMNIVSLFMEIKNLNYVCMYVCMDGWMYVCMYVCMYVGMYLFGSSP